MYRCEQRIWVWRMRRDVVEEEGRRGSGREEERMNRVKGEV